jgi:hypothetical protein
MDDLLLAECINKKLDDKMPVFYNHLFQGGYFNMPSGRMGDEGEVGLGGAYVHPYHMYSVRAQLTERVEVTGNYRVFRGVEDPILSEYGFGDLSDKGANVKIAILRPEDSQYRLPGFAFGFEDFMGTRSFKSRYAVFTKVFKDANFEISLGWGWQRIHGFFGGMLWVPFRSSNNAYFNQLALALEYDATDYKNESVEKHPDGRRQRTPFNVGVKYKFGKHLDFSFSYIRGCEYAASMGLSYNLGTTQGFIPKIDDPLPYNAPANREEIGCLRPEEMVVFDLAFPFREQGFDLLEVAFSYDECRLRRMHIRIYNNSYRVEREVRERLNALLYALVPSNVHSVIAVVMSEGFPIQEYRYDMEWVRRFGAKQICEYELEILTPLTEAGIYQKRVVFEQQLPLYNFYLEPRTHTVFGSSSGKFKYSLGVNFGVDGYFWKNIYYSFLFGYNILQDMRHTNDMDRLNPSQIINVRSDAINYYKESGIILDQGYIQKNWALGRAWYAKTSLGYFEQAYAGLAGELLYYPLYNPFAVGFEAGVFKKRNYRGLGFQNNVRKLKGFQPSYRRFTGSQFFLNLYYRWYAAELDFKISTGKFLANDFGSRFEVSRYFPSGLKLFIWYTLTNGGDRINGKTYHDKGAGFSMPLDIFYTYSDRERFGYGMSAWMRDVGARAETGLDLYDLITQERQW